MHQYIIFTIYIQENLLNHFTYIMLPHDFVSIRIRANFALEIYVIAFFDVIRIHIRAELQMQNWNNCNEKICNISY